MDIHIKTNKPIPKLACLYDEEFVARFEYFLIHGGRGGGKTEEMARKGIITTFQDPYHWLCTREVQASIDDSVKATIEEWIVKLEVQPFFVVTKTEIINRITGAKFLFKGMKAGTERDTIKSLKGVKYIWCEEAQGMTAESWLKLNPTIRIDGRKLFFTYNPEEGDAPIEMIREFGDKVCDIEVNYYDNPYCPDVLLEQAAFSKKYRPIEYNHVWLGQPLLHGDRQTVLTLDQLRRCIDAHKTFGHAGGHSYGGLDLAPGEGKKNDRNSLVIRTGPVVRFAKNWQCADLDKIADLVMARGRQFGLIRLFFDAVGCGGFATSTLRKRKPAFACIPFMGGNSAMGGDYSFMRSGAVDITNADYFKNCKSQQWWNLRLRAENTLRLLDGETIRDPSYYLSFDSSTIEPEAMDSLLRQLTQATWKEDSSGRIVIDKCPGDYEVTVDGKKEKRRSPNDGDSCGYAFVRDFQLRGLKIK